MGGNVNHRFIGMTSERELLGLEMIIQMIHKVNLIQ